MLQRLQAHVLTSSDAQKWVVRKLGFDEMQIWKAGCFLYQEGFDYKKQFEANALAVELLYNTARKENEADIARLLDVEIFESDYVTTY